MARPFNKDNKVKIAINEMDPVKYTWAMIDFTFYETRKHPNTPLARDWIKLLNSLSTIVAQRGYPTEANHNQVIADNAELKQGLDLIKEYLMEDPPKIDINTIEKEER